MPVSVIKPTIEAMVAVKADHRNTFCLLVGDGDNDHEHYDGQGDGEEHPTRPG